MDEVPIISDTLAVCKRYEVLHGVLYPEAHGNGFLKKKKKKKKR
jgi:hypothetical protein